MRLIFLSLAWVAGIYIGSLVSPPLYAFLLALILSLTIALLWRKRRVFLWGGLCLIVLFSGIGFYQWKISEPTLQSFNNQGIVELRGKVDRDPQFDYETSKLSLSAQEIKIDSGWEEVSGKVLIYTRVFPAYSQGDLLKVRGELRSLSQI